MILSINFDKDKPKEQLSHNWELMVGSGHFSLLNRRDLSKQLLQAKNELGFQYFRCHGILNDDLLLVLDEDVEKDQILTEEDLNFVNIDKNLDYMISIGVKPFMELGFMPKALASGETTVFYYKANVTPPKSLKTWKSLIDQLIKHFLERYGKEEVESWFFECWNEPDLTNFWTGTKEDYFNFYKATAEAIKGINPNLRVGGPATSKCNWIGDFLEFCNTNSTPVDFISTHIYPSTAPSNREKKNEDNKKKNNTKNFRRDWGFNQIKNAKRLIKESFKPDLPLYITEFNSSTSPFDITHDKTNQAAFICNFINRTKDITEGVSYWTVSDIFEEAGFPDSAFHGGFGLTTIFNIPKPSWNSYLLLHMLGTKKLNYKLNSSKRIDDTGIFCATNDAEDEIDILLYWYKNPLALPANDDNNGNNVTTEEDKSVKMKILIDNIPPIFQRSSIKTYRIEDEQSNPFKAWELLNAPKSPTPSQIKQLYHIAKPSPDILNLSIYQKCELDVVLKPESVIFLKITAKLSEKMREDAGEFDNFF